jgi:hypothetical protein
MKDYSCSDFSLVPERCWRAIVKDGLLGEILWALATDPNEADEIYAWRDEMPTMSHFRDQCGNRGVDAALQTISEWNMLTLHVPSSVAAIARFDHRLGVWCCLQASRHLASFFPASPFDEPLSIVDAWIRGRASPGSVHELSNQMATPLNDEYIMETGYTTTKTAIFHLLCSVTRSPKYHLESMIVQGGKAFGFIQNGEPYNYITHNVSFSNMMISFREKISEACMTFPR